MDFDDKLVLDIEYARTIYGCQKIFKGKKCKKMIWERDSHSFQGTTPPTWLCRWWIKYEKEKGYGRPKYLDTRYTFYDEFPDFDDPIPTHYFDYKKI
jgi:hypothetical protein